MIKLRNINMTPFSLKISHNSKLRNKQQNNNINIFHSKDVNNMKKMSLDLIDDKYGKEAK